LAEAMVAGGPVIATRFPHAVEMLGDGSGILVKHRNPTAIAEAIRSLIRNAELRRYMRDKTAAKANAFLWPSVGASMATLTNAVLREAAVPRSVDYETAQVSA